MSLLRIKPIKKNDEDDKCPDIEVYADAVLFGRDNSSEYIPRHRQECFIYGLSMIGPEQSLRALSGLCCIGDFKDRRLMRITGPKTRIFGQWAPSWRPKAIRLTRGAMHVVAIQDLTATEISRGNEQTHVIISESERHLAADLYERLTTAYSTPLIPMEQPGQTAEEKELAKVWASTLTARIMSTRTLFQRLETHPDQTDQCWSTAALLSLTRATLDAMVSELVRNGGLPFPRNSNRPTIDRARVGANLTA